MSRIKLPYGIKEGKLVHVAYVKQGANCECICPKCAGDLIAAKGEINVEHFRHKDLSDCEGAAEFALRARIMELLNSSLELTLPESLDTTSGHSETLVEKTTVKIESIQLAKTTDPLTPRFEIKTSGHDQDEGTITVIVNLGKKAPKDTQEDKPYIEINLADFDELTEERLRETVHERTDCWHWIKRPLAEKRLKEKLQYSSIRTTPEDAEEILIKARRVRESDFYKPTWEDAFAQPLKPRPYSTTPRKQVPLSCRICGREEVPEKEMQRFKSDSGVGVCWKCLRGGKS